MGLEKKILELEGSFKSIIKATNELQSEFKLTSTSVKSIETLASNLEAMSKQVKSVKLAKTGPAKPVGDQVIDELVGAIEKAKEIQGKITFEVEKVKTNLNNFLKSMEGKSIKVRVSILKDTFTKSLKNVQASIKSVVEKPYKIIIETYNNTKKGVKAARDTMRRLRKEAKNQPLEAKVKIYGNAALKSYRKFRDSLSDKSILVAVETKMENAMKGFNKLKKGFKNLIPGGSIASMLSEGGGKAVEYLTEKLKKGFSKAWKNRESAKQMTENMTRAKAALAKVDGTIQNVVTGIFSKLLNSGGGKGSNVLTQVVDVFENLASWFAENEETIINSVSNLITGLFSGFGSLMTFLQPVFGFIGNLFGMFMQWVQKAGETLTTMMPAIKETLAAVLDWVAPKLAFISEVLGFLFEKWLEYWPVILGVWEEVWNIIKPGFIFLGEVIDGVFAALEGVFNFVQDNWHILEETISTVGDIINGTFEALVGTLENVSNFLGGILSDVMSMVGLGGDDSSGNKHAAGIGYVPYDNYPAILHKGERVMTASDNDQLRRGGSGVVINIPKLADSINASSAVDVDVFLGKLEDKLVNMSVNMGG